MKLVSVHIPVLVFLFLIAGLSPSKSQVWSINQCIDTAQVYNKNLRISRNNISIGEQKQKEALGNLFPKVTANTDYKYFTDLPYQLMPLSVFGGPEGQFKEAQFGVPHNMNANLQFTMPLYHPQAYGAIKISEIASELTQLQYQKTKEQIFFEISNLYYNAQILHHQLEFIEGNLLNMEKLFTNIKLLHEQLLATATDVNKVRLQLTQLTTQKENIINKYMQVLNTLKFAMGIDIEQKFDIDSTIQRYDKIEYNTTSTIDIIIAQSQFHLKQRELTLLKQSRLPSFSLFGTYGVTGFGYNQEPNSFLKFYPVGFLGVQVSYPLFNGTITQRKINQKKLEMQNSNLQLGQITEQNAMLTENAKLQRQSAQQSLETTLEQIQSARAIYEQTLLMQKQGRASLTDVLLDDNALRAAQQMYLSAVVDYLKSDLELKKMTGNISKMN